jgi:hypothetical protein
MYYMIVAARQLPGLPSETQVIVPRPHGVLGRRRLGSRLAQEGRRRGEVHRFLHRLDPLQLAQRLGSGRIAASESEAPILLGFLVEPT